MIKKFFIQIIIITLVVCFFGLNFDTKVDIRFWFNEKMTFKGISLFISLAAAYGLGVISTLPFLIARSFKKKKNNKKNKQEISKNTDKINESNE